jgi:serine/threonine-protein kinase
VQPAKQPAQPRPAGRGFFGRLLITLVALVLIGATVLAAFPGLLAQLPSIDNLPIQNPLATPTAQTLIQQPYSVELEVVVPPGGDVRAAFEVAYQVRAQAEFGPGTRVNANAPLAYIGGDPVELGEDASGTKYRATVSGYVLVPQ